MFIADETHSRISTAMDGLFETEMSLADVVWAAKMLQLLLISADLDDTQNVVKIARENRERILGMRAVLADCKKAVTEARDVLELARGKIPNTTPPDPRGFESCAS